MLLACQCVFHCCNFVVACGLYDLKVSQTCLGQIIHPALKAKNVSNKEWEALRADIQSGSQCMRGEDANVEVMKGGVSGSSKDHVAQAVNLSFFDDQISPSKEQWNKVEDLIKILDRTDKEGSACYSKMCEFLEDQSKATDQGKRMLNELEDFVYVMESVYLSIL